MKLRRRTPVKSIKRLLKSNSQEIESALDRLQAVDLAEIWHHFNTEERVGLFESISRDFQSEVFEKLDLEYQKELLDNLNTSQISQTLNSMAPDDRADLFAKLPEYKAESLLSVMKRTEARDVRDLLEYEEHTAGGKMTTDFVTLSPEMTAREALAKIQDSVDKEHQRNIYAVYSVDSSGHLLAGILLQKLIASDPDVKIKDITRTVDRIKINEKEDQERVANIFAHYDLLSAPVVDDDDKLVGVITIDDIVDVIHEELNEDIAIKAGTEVLDFEPKSILKSVKTRWLWLMTSFAGGLAAAVIIGIFEGTLAEVAALAVFIPIIMDMGGNVGVQSSTVVVRRLALNRAEHNWHEIASGELLSGLLMSAGFGILLWIAANYRYTSSIAWASGLGIALALAISTVLGVFLPIFFHKHNIDPAISTGPLITTAIDVIGLGVYFLLAIWIVL